MVKAIPFRVTLWPMMEEASRETAAPISVTDDGDARRAGIFVGFSDAAAQKRRHAQAGEIFSGDHLAVGQRGFPVDADGRVLVVEAEWNPGESAGKDVALRAEFLECRIGEGKFRVPAGLAEVRRPFVIVPLKQNELLRVFHRQRLQHHGVDEAENCGVGADAESESEDGDSSESGGLEQHPQAVTNVLKESVHGSAQHLEALDERSRQRSTSKSCSLADLSTHCSLFVTQGDHGIGAHGAARGNVAGHEGDGQQQNRHGRKCERVGCSDAEEFTGKNARERKGRGEADGEAQNRKHETLAQNEAQNIARLSSKSHANADFVSALAGGVSENAVDSDAGENQRNDAKAADENAGKALCGGVELNARIESSEIEERQIGVKGVNGALNRRNESEGIARHASVNSDAAVVVLEKRQVEERLWFLAKLKVVAVLGDADNGEPSSVGVELFADGILMRPVAIDKGGVDDGDELRSIGVGGGKFAAGDHGNLHGSQIVGADVGILNVHRFVGLRNVTFRLDGISFGVKSERNPVSECRRFDAWNRAELVEELTMKLCAGFGVVAETRKIVIIEQDMMGVESGIELLGDTDAAE